MTNEEKKELLIKDLCGRLPYGVKIHGSKENDDILWELDYNIDIKKIVDDGWLPYLRPMSSMTEEEFKEWHDVIRPMYDGKPYASEGADIDFFNKYHFDYRGLIPMGLALPATKDMYQQLKTK